MKLKGVRRGIGAPREQRRYREVTSFHISAKIHDAPKKKKGRRQEVKKRGTLGRRTPTSRQSKEKNRERKRRRPDKDPLKRNTDEGCLRFPSPHDALKKVSKKKCGTSPVPIIEKSQGGGGAIRAQLHPPRS